MFKKFNNFVLKKRKFIQVLLKRNLDWKKHINRRQVLIHIC